MTNGPIPPVDATLKRIVIAYRVLAFAWLSALITSTLATDEGANAAIAILAWAAAAVSASVVIGVSRRREWLTSWPVLIGDLAVATFIGIAPGLAGSVDLFFGGYLLSTLILIIYARPQIWVGVLAVAILGATQILVPILSAVRNLRATDAAGDLAAFIVTTAVFGWGMEMIRRSERGRMDAEAALNEERILRARADDRADIGSHLHDSVLQSLALIRQRSEEPAEVTHLARRQERELRRWIDQMSSEHDSSVRAALRDAAAEVEDRYRVTIDVVVVGDKEMDEPCEAAIKAAREALANAAKYSGQSQISVYAELGNGCRVFVRDRGPGFDPEEIGDRRGISESIVGRMRRHGGAATIRSAPGEGTEVEIEVRGTMQ